MTENLPDDWFRPRERAGDGSPAQSPAPSRVILPPPVAPTDEQPTQQRFAAAVTETTLASVSRRHWLGRHPVLSTALVMVVALAVGVSASHLWQNRRLAADNPAPSSAPVSSPSPSVLKPYEGATKPVKPTAVTASCTAPDATDSAGALVSYQPDLVLDANPATAWRCDGDGRGQKLTFTFPPGTVLVGVGLINGYAKQSGDESLYPQYRRVMSVEWRLDQKLFFTQSLSDNNLTLQQVAIPEVPAGESVTMTILESTTPGRAEEPTRDAVLISQVQFLTRA